MNPLLQTHFETALDHPNGIKKLRELILSLAMQGKLVIQDKNDQPARELLKEIQAEKERLVKEGKIKKTDALPPIKEEEKPFVIPESWEWVRLGEVTTIIGDGIHGTPFYDTRGEYYFVNGNNLINGKIEFKNSTKMVSKIEYEKYKKPLNFNTVLVSINGTIGNIAFYNGENIILGKSACFFNLSSGISKYFIKLLINSIWFLKYAISSATGTTIANVSLKAMREFPLPLPPLAEQKRIVEKVDQLFLLCDELERLQQSRNSKRKELHNSVLTQCIEADSVSSFQTSFQFLTTHFHELYSVKENVKELRKAVLQLAVMGKLVPQDKNDQPARELLKEIQAEKERLVKEGKIRKMDALPPIKDEEKPFVLPEGWEWVRLGEVCMRITDGTHQTPKYTSSGGIFLSAQNVKPFHFKPEKHKFVSIYDFENYRKDRNPEYLDILLTRVGSNIGEAAVIDKKIEFAIYVSLGLIKIFKNLQNSYYYVLFLNSPYGTNLSSKNTLGKGASQGNLNLNLIKNFPLPLPPLAEQKRIVKKVDELFALCDRLEEEIEKAELKRGEILEGMTRL